MLSLRRVLFVCAVLLVCVQLVAAHFGLHPLAHIHINKIHKRKHMTGVSVVKRRRVQSADEREWRCVSSQSLLSRCVLVTSLGAVACLLLM